MIISNLNIDANDIELLKNSLFYCQEQVRHLEESNEYLSTKNNDLRQKN